ncbi:hypothetical protein RUM43_009938 [Polyplax serrata]|uniref:Peptidase S1 domain-containing protein n=1 Tax=Polyplax serrata TaxID=468196 RepID=A0AAN8S4J8_POLSC
MNTFVTVAVLAAAALVSARPDLGVNPYILGGSVAANGSFPFVVALRDAHSKEVFCSGALIHERFIITSYDCAKRPVENILVGMGDVHLSQQSFAEVNSKYFDNEYVPGVQAPKYYLAILRLTDPVKLSPTIQLADFSYAGNLEDKEVTAMGWGSTEDLQESSDLLEMKTTTMSNNKCLQVLEPSMKGDLKSGHICVGGRKTSGICFGDEGSPLVYVENGKQYTVGIYAFGTPCEVGNPDVFFRLSHSNEWIKKILHNH